MATRLSEKIIKLYPEIRTRNICIDIPENGQLTIRVERQEVLRDEAGCVIAAKTLRTLSFGVERLTAPSRQKLMADIAAHCDAIDEEVTKERTEQTAQAK